MVETKIKISNVIENQIPEFINEENPLFKEFLTQYYISQEFDYSTINLAENIPSYKHIDTYANVGLSTITAVVTANVLEFDDIINVSTTVGFPAKYGLLKINDEIITYTGITTNSFLGCIRGFSGISEIDSNSNSGFLTFNSTIAQEHSSNSSVINLSNIFLNEFFRKFKNQFLPGFENRNFLPSISLENVLSRARDFYSSKGSDTALKILFKVLFGTNVDIIKPFDNTIIPSSAQWVSVDEMIVEAIEGNPLNLNGFTLYQYSLQNPTASGPISNVEDVYFDDKHYYKISFPKNSINGNFEVNTKTKVITTSTNEVVTVDSTIGFDDSGSFYYLNEETNEYLQVQYSSKSHNQFFDCTGLTNPLIENTEIITGNFVYGYENNDLNSICTMRVVGSISNVSDGIENTKYFQENDEIKLKYIGEKPLEDDKKFSTWFYNNILYVESNYNGSNTIKTKSSHFLNRGDRVDIIEKENNSTVISSIKVIDLLDSTRFKFENTNVSLDLNKDYYIKKKINFVSNNLNLNYLMSNIQNSFIDKNKNCYILFSGYPSYEDLQTSNRSKTFSVTGSVGVANINIPSHGFITGDRVYLHSASSGISSGYYYTNKVDDDNLNLSLSKFNIYSKQFLNFNGSGTIIPEDLYGKNLKNQNNFKRILQNPEKTSSNKPISGQIGVSLNGLEIYSPISNDSVFYGQLKKIITLSNGSNYNVVSPPSILIEDSSGSGAEAYPHLTGYIDEIILESPGFDYLETPQVTITGGNGYGSVAEAKMTSYQHSVSFTDLNTSLGSDSFILNENHKFLDGEEVKYTCTGIPVGIGSTNVGFSTTKLSNNSIYYIAKVNDNQFSITTTKENALSKTKIIDLVSFGNGVHSFSSTKFKNVIDRIVVKNKGLNYSNNKVVVNSISYPPTDKKDIFKTFVGINTYDDYIFAINHNFNNGDLVTYSTNGTPIIGLSTSNYYKVTVLDENSFKLSYAGTSSSITSFDYENKIYSNIKSLGTGKHIFNYPPITVNITGNVAISSSQIPSYYNATAYASVSGGIKNIFLTNGGVGYGVTNIVNLIRQPKITLQTGSGGLVNVLVNDNGEITDAYVLDKGQNYTTEPIIEVIGTGNYAKLKANISNNQITSITILNKGKGYSKNNTIVRVIPRGSDAIFSAEIQKWSVNYVKRYEDYLNDQNYKGTIQISSDTNEKENKLISFYASKEIRKILNDNLTENYEELEENWSHSPIIGWAYDGNPIYGPYGNSSPIPQPSLPGGIKSIKSSYSLNIINDISLRPPYQNGYFIEDYVFDNSGDLDEFNGRFIVNSDFPNGTYAYFSTLDQNKTPSFPYITFKHHNATDLFNYDILKTQSDEYLNTGEYKRNIVPQGINENYKKYPFFDNIFNSNVDLKVSSSKKSKISSIDIKDGGLNYKVGDRVLLSDNNISCYVKEIIGKNVVSISSSESTNTNISFSFLDKKITAFSTVPHNFSDGDIIEISGISSSSYKSIEGLRKINVQNSASSLYLSIGSTSVTGMTTFISMYDSTKTGNFKENDIIQINSEKLLILNVDHFNNRYRVQRGYDNTVGVSHTQSSKINLLPRIFSFYSNKALPKNTEENYSYYFDPETSVGIGSTYTNLIVSTSGGENIIKSIPPRSIYLPNHRFNTGDILSYSSIGFTLNASSNDSLSPTFQINGISPLYCVKLSDEFIGISTQKVGYTTSYVYFTSYSGKNHKLESIKNSIKGTCKKINVTVTTDEEHELKKDDVITLDLTPKITQYFNFKYNDTIKKLVVNPTTFLSSSVSIGITDSSITLNNHNYETGDIVVYSSANPITPLENNGIYYIIKVSNSLFKLAENYHKATKTVYENIIFTSSGSGNHGLSLINPKLTFYKGNNIEISVSDSSLNGYDIKFYYDNEFKSEFNSTFIKRYGSIGNGNQSSKIIISTNDLSENQFFYKIEGKDIKFSDTYPSSANTEVKNYSLIDIKKSSYNGSHIITGIGSTSFTFTLPGIAETSLYNSSGFSTSYYSTNSKNTKGKISSLKIIDFGQNISRIPQISSIQSNEGTFAVLSVESNDIGQIRDTKVINQGLEFSSNKTLTPKADSYVILKLKDVYKLKSIDVISPGKDYTIPPKVIAIGNPSILTKTSLKGSSVSKVEIISNDSGLSDRLRIVSTNNSNGVGIINATSSFKTNTLFLKAPIAGFEKFPFVIGDKIFVENVFITDSADGYNSSDYDYTHFTITGINTISGSESIAYSISGLGTNGGTYDLTKNFGRVIKLDDVSSLKPVFEKISFNEGEKITELGGKAFGYVAKNGWDENSQTLKLINVSGKFTNNSQIKGSLGNYKSSVDNMYLFDFDLKVNSTVKKDKDWTNDLGKLNYDSQRIHDNDYYQRFSYSIRGTVPYEKWKEPVNSLTHVSGFKNFSNLEIINGIGNSVTTKASDSNINLNLEIQSSASVYDRFYYDLASEDTDNSTFSSIIKLESKIITDYNESRTNKVLQIDDISSQFTGIVTSIGGGVVGLTSFVLLSEQKTLLYKKFTPSDVSLNSSSITIIDHEFNTGEKLKYSPNQGSEIGIVTTSIVGIGTTDLMPSDVYAIRLSKDTIKLAIGKSESNSGLALTFTSSGSGANHSFSVDSDLATSRSLISIDNVIQSPLSRKNILVGLSTEVGLSTTKIYLNDISKIQGKTLIKIEDEIVKVDLVGIGSTNSLSVVRGFMGTVSSAHTVGSKVTVLSGDYTIKDGIIYFSEAPYGPYKNNSRSSFAGRIFYRLNYDTNYIIDDISEEFNGVQNNFNLKSYNNTISGIQSSFGIVLVNNIFQKPFYGDVGSILKSDYQIVGTGQTISFTGTNYENLPKGGIINEFDILSNGIGYQSPYTASAYAVVSAAGTIQSIGLTTGGSGYTFAPRVSIADTLGVGIGASIISSISNGIVTSFTIVNSGVGYTTSSPPIVIIDNPSPYKNLQLFGGSGYNAKMNVVVGTGGSIISFDLQNKGYGYNVGDELILSGLPFNVGIATSSFKIKVKNRYQNKFSAWTLGQLIELDDFSNLFNGVRKSFLLTRTIVTKDYYSINALKDSGIILRNNLLIFINDILQLPGIDYTFDGGTRIKFLEAPKYGSKMKIYFYSGSSNDYFNVDIDQSIKIGDKLKLQRKNSVPEQDERIVYELISSDSVETQTYSGVGIVAEATFTRPVKWTKQTSDLTIDGLSISKKREYLEAQVFPITNIISSVSKTDSKIYVRNTYPLFNQLDDLSQTLNDITIVGIGTTVVTEKIKKVTYSGDYGIIVGIGTSSSGINTTSPMLIFDIKTDPIISQNISMPGIKTGDYFVIENTTVGSGVTSIKNDISSVVCIGKSFIDNVYYANDFISIGSTILRVFSNVQSVSGIQTSQLVNLRNYGTYTWGSINVMRNSDSKSFDFYNQNGLLGIETSAYIRRNLQLRLSY